MLFDQIVFQIERFAFVFDDEEVDLGRLVKHFLFSERGGREILSEPFLEVFGFSDIQNSSFPVFEQVNSWVLWYFRDIAIKQFLRILNFKF